jgi:hypothetical protein
MTPKYINYDVIILSFELLMRVKPVMTSCNQVAIPNLVPIAKELQMAFNLYRVRLEP